MTITAYGPRWHTVAEVAQMLGYGLSKTKMLVATGQIRSLKDGRNRRILPEWVDEYVARRAKEAAELYGWHS
ncbi:excisionase family DNA-binding protein [Hamadaea sp. NPDC051192]|uniref:excisionase family DNA-binding protein n=1 Tax=Hamadaea sp. NPDC051192 TaxID=3154940 RepID=UPI003436DF33